MDRRDPPEHVKKILRKEVNYGCPVEGCGNPYLSFHHFDPTWHVLHHHNPTGMIAMCLEHAGHADADSWTVDQLREMKQIPFVTEEQVSRLYYYLRKDVVCKIGNIAARVKNILEIDGERVIGFERDERGYDGLNLKIRDKEGNIILEMINNVWTAYTRGLFDLICPARGKEIQIISKEGNTKVRIRFHDYSLNSFRTLFNTGLSASIMDLEKALKKNQSLSIEVRDEILNQTKQGMLRSFEDLIAAIGTPLSVPVWSITGTLEWADKVLKIGDFKVREKSRNKSINMNILIDRRSALGFENDIFQLG